MAEQAVEQQSESEAPDKQADGTPAPVSTEEPAAQGATAPDVESVYEQEDKKED